jgi:hypothetical protein
METTVLGIVLDSSAVIAAERRKLEVADFIDEILQAHGPVASRVSCGPSRGWGSLHSTGRLRFRTIVARFRLGSLQTAVSKASHCEPGWVSGNATSHSLEAARSVTAAVRDASRSAVSKASSPSAYNWSMLGYEDAMALLLSGIAAMGCFPGVLPAQIALSEGGYHPMPSQSSKPQSRQAFTEVANLCCG